MRLSSMALGTAVECLLQIGALRDQCAQLRDECVRTGKVVSIYN